MFSVLLIYVQAQSIFATPSTLFTSSSAVLPGHTLSGTFSDAGNQDTSLPTEGRYLLWIISGVFALETQDTVPLIEFDPNASQEVLLPNPTVLVLPKYNLGPSYVLFHDPDYLPLNTDFPTVAERLPRYTVLFDTNHVIQNNDSVSGFDFELGVNLNSDGLYLMEGQTIRYRYLEAENFWLADQSAVYNPKAFLLEDIQTFLAGGQPKFEPLVAVPGFKFPESLVTFEKPALLMIASSYPPEYPEIAEYQSTLFNLLPQLLAEYGVEPVALWLGDDYPQSRELLPQWRIVPAPPLPYQSLLLSEMTYTTTSIVVKPGGEIVGSLCIFHVKEEPNDTLLRQALEKAVNP